MPIQASSRRSSASWAAVVLAAIFVAALVCAVGLPPLGGADSARADEPPPDANRRARVAELIEQLSDARYVVREKAAASLKRIGMPAQRQLRAALKSPDAEVRVRAQQILEAVLAADFERRLRVFLADGARGAKLPAWDEARKVLGDDRAARALFVQMLREERELLLAFDKSPEQCGPQLARSATGLYNIMCIKQDNTDLPLGGVAAVLLVGSHPEVLIDDQFYANICEIPVYCPQLKDALGNSKLRPKLIELLAGWIGKSAKLDWRADGDAMQLGYVYKLDAALAPAARLLKDANTVSPLRGRTVLAFGMLGDRDDLELIEPLLDDRQSCSRKQVGPVDMQRYVKVQIRDVALAVLVHLTGQDLKEYGYKQAAKFPLRSLFCLREFYFPNDVARQRALAKWKAWREKAN